MVLLKKNVRRAYATVGWRAFQRHVFMEDLACWLFVINSTLLGCPYGSRNYKKKKCRLGNWVLAEVEVYIG